MSSSANSYNQYICSTPRFDNLYSKRGFLKSYIERLSKIRTVLVNWLFYIHFFIENSKKSASDNADMLAEFKACSSKNGAVLLGVCGGRNSQGEDYPGDFMNAAIIVGIPYHMPTPRAEAKIKYYDKQFIESDDNS